MIAEFTHFDHSLFLWIQANLRCSILDTIFPIWRSMFFWIPLYIFIVSYILVKLPFRIATTYVVLVFLVFLITDTLSAKIIKPQVQRNRPCIDVSISPFIKKIINCGSGYSFPSSHASNHMGLSVILILLFNNWKFSIKLGLIIWALSIGIAQIYVGLHYPFDVFAGFVIGFLVAEISYLIFKKVIIHELD